MINKHITEMLVCLPHIDKVYEQMESHDGDSTRTQQLCITY